MDSETRYILASHLTPRRDANAARVVLRKAALAAEKPPETIVTDKLKSYTPAVKGCACPKPGICSPRDITADLNNNLSRADCKGLSGTASRRCGAWTARRPGNATSTAGHCNTTSFGITRASAETKPQGSGPRSTHRSQEWADVVKAGAASRRKVKAETRPTSQSQPKSPQPEAAAAPEAKGRKSLRRSDPWAKEGSGPEIGQSWRHPSWRCPRRQGRKGRSRRWCRRGCATSPGCPAGIKFRFGAS